LALSFVPQIVKTYRCKKVDDISVGLYIMLLVGFLFQMAYSISIESWPFIANYTWNMIMTIAFLILYLKYRGAK